MNKDNYSPEFEYLEKLILYRLETYFPAKKNSGSDDSITAFDPVRDFPALHTWRLPWQKFAKDNNLTDKREELTVLLIGIIPHIRPGLFDSVIAKKIHEPNNFPNIGGINGKNSRYFLPTGETALFLLAGEDFNLRLQAKQLFGAEHIFWEKKIIWLEDMQNGEPSMHGRLVMSLDYIDLLTYGSHKSPQFSISFPARKIAPANERTGSAPSAGQLVISDELKQQIQELKNWLKYNKQLTQRFGRRNMLKRGYRTLFYGPPGTGKTFTAQILGNDPEVNREVYKIDLSMVVSKYIGETEKNLELLFARAEDKDWILFFDEADALFGKRTNVRDAHDKYANQEVSYLLQRIEDYNGLVILATNMKNNIDDAFIRRFNSILKFPFPDVEQRARIWENSFAPLNAQFRERPGEILPGKYDEYCTPGKEIKEVNIPEAVKKYELSGGSIINVVHFAGIKAMERYNEALALSPKGKGLLVQEGGDIDVEEDDCDPRPPFIIYLSDVLEGVKRELIKEGKPFAI